MLARLTDPNFTIEDSSNNDEDQEEIDSDIQDIIDQILNAN